MGRIRQARVTVARYEMEDERDNVSESAWFDLWYQSPGWFRSKSTGIMGSQSLLVSDGVAMLRWSGGESVRLVDAPRSFAEAGTDVRSTASFLYLLLDGEGQFAKLVSESGRIVRLAGSDGLETIEFVSPNIGTVRLGCDPATRLAMTAMLVRPRGGGSPFGGSRITLDRAIKLELGAVIGGGLLSTQAPPGFSVLDQRKAKAEGTGHGDHSVAN
jgi:hypothetical protein